MHDLKRNSYFYPRSPCGERPVLRAQGCRSISISIHALLAESDRRAHVAAVARCQFLSTLSLRRATWRPDRNDTGGSNFYPRSPCGERPRGLVLQVARFHFYPRSPCGERLYRPAKPAPPRDFYPRSPCGERRLHNAGQDGLCHISIHALLAESDSSSPSGSGRLWVFLSTLSLRRATSWGR